MFILSCSTAPWPSIAVGTYFIWGVLEAGLDVAGRGHGGGF